MIEQVLSYLGRIFSFDPSSPLLFTSFHFWVFFALVYAGFALAGNRLMLRNAFLLLASLLFYYKTSGLSVLILMFVTVSDYLIAGRIHRSPSPRARKAWLTLSVFIDLLILSYFKYSYFLADALTSLTGLEFRAVNLFGSGSIVLPVGISFYIFQVISYTVDVYRGDVKPVRNILDFGFYVSFFPQLVAGPIVRASEFIPQIYRKFSLSRRQFGLAVFWVMSGLAKKLILSDYIAVNFVDRVFENPLLFTGFENFAALVGYSLQVYADFSGYTDIATGIAMMMGFYLPQNFDSPYKASNPQDFWRRWHMSLSRWLKTYLYIPLGGNRRASFGTWLWIGLFALIAALLSGSLLVSLVFVVLASACALLALLRPSSRKVITSNINRFITMLLGGLWHGASWNFIIWGGLNGIGLVAWQLWKGMARWLRMALMTLLCSAAVTAALVWNAPIWNILAVWAAVLWLGTLVRTVYSLLGGKGCGRAGYIWGVAQTFAFITFTRLFFRSGSNLDPATANETAIRTARNMVERIGSDWNLRLAGQICAEYWKPFSLIVLGLAIHWLPSRWKRRFRINFALLPLPVLAIVVVAIVFILYQFSSAGLQAFIYFQF